MSLRPSPVETDPMQSRVVYSLLWHLLLPIVFLKLWWRGRKEPGYRQFIWQRFGWYTTPLNDDRPVIWLHAVSLGETRAAQPLVKALAECFPQYQLVITHMTATGRAAATELYGEFATIATLPYDLPWAMRRFLRHFRPAIGLLMETEVWPNLCHQAQLTRIPIALVNARLSARSARGYQRFSRLTRPAFAAFDWICAQSAADAERLQSLGGGQIAVCGNVKFDVALPAKQIALGHQLRHWIGAKQVLLFASSREGEEALLLDAWQRSPLSKQCVLLIVPRHPQRFDEVATLISQYGWPAIRRQGADLHHSLAMQTGVILGDSMGEMVAYYAAADLCLIGGSITPLGGQNLIEAAAAGCPSLLGPHMFNFSEASQAALAAEAALSVNDAEAALLAAHRLLTDKVALDKMQAAALAFAAAHQGATGKIIDQLSLHLGSSHE